MDATQVHSSATSYVIFAGVIAAVIVIGLVLWVWLKGRPLPGDHVFRASRLSKGNRLFPSQLAITSSSITLYKPQWIGRQEESIHTAHIASIKITTHVLFSDIFIETSGGQDPVVSHGHTKGDAVKIKNLIEKFQTDYYGGKAAGPAAPRA